MPSRAARAIEPCALGAARRGGTTFAGLARVGTRIARGLSAVLASAGHGSAIASDARTQTLRDWKAGLPPQVAVARYRDPAIKGGLLLSMPPSLVSALVDVHYGGKGAPTPVSAIFGAGEHRLFDRIARAAGDAIAAGWAEIAALAPALAGSVYAAEDVTFGKLDDAVVVQQFVLGANPPAATIDLVYPLAALRDVMGRQAAGSDTLVERAILDVDPDWQRRMSDAVMQARLPVRTVIARPTVSLASLMSLAPGDILPVTLPARVPLTVAGRLLAHGTIGEANGRAAIMIDSIEQGTLND